MKDEKRDLYDHSPNKELDENERGSPQEPYEVGYRKPPLETRWKRGQPGNPAGRPRGSLSKKTIQRMVEEVFLQSCVTIKDQNGKPGRTVSKAYAMLLDAANRGVKGNHHEKKFALELIEKFVLAGEAETVKENAAEDDAILRRHGLGRAPGLDSGSSDTRDAVGPNEGQDKERGGD